MLLDIETTPTPECCTVAKRVPRPIGRSGCDESGAADNGERVRMRSLAIAVVVFLLLLTAGAEPMVAGTFTTISDPLGTNGTFAFGVSGSDIVGEYSPASGPPQGFLYNGSSYTTLSDPLGVNGTFAYGISGSNIVGYYIDASDNAHGFLYNGTSYTTLDDPLGVNGTYPQGVHGTNIVGIYLNASEQIESFLYQPSAVPEPCSMLLAVLGFGGLIPFCRRRRSKAPEASP